MRRNVLVNIAVAATFLFAAPGVHAQSGSEGNMPTFAVADFNGFLLGEAGNSAPVGKAVTNMLITELSQRSGINVIERYRLQELLREQQLSLSGRVESSAVQQVGQMLGAGYFITGAVSGVGENLRMDIRLLDTETSEVLKAEKLTDRTERLLAMVEEIADSFMDAVDADVELEAAGDRPEPVEIPVMATIHYSRAVDYRDKGETAKAIEFAEKALEEHPDHKDAKKLLDELKQEGGSDR